MLENSSFSSIPSLEKYYMMIAFIVASRANCLNRSVGCVIVSSDNKSILSTGYNGVPAGLPHCSTCRRREEGFGSGEGLHRSRSSHAEQNAIVQAAKYGKVLNESILYCTTLPCNECTKMIINSNILKIYYCDEYPTSEAKEMLKFANIEVVRLDKKEIFSNLNFWINNLMSI